MNSLQEDLFPEQKGEMIPAAQSDLISKREAAKRKAKATKEKTRKQAARLEIRLDPYELEDFQNYAKANDLTVSQLIRKYIRETLKNWTKETK